MRAIFGAMLVLLLMATAIHAQVAPTDPERAARLAALVEWTRGDGDNSRLQGGVVHVLGLGPREDIPSKREAYRDEKTNIIYGINLVTIDGHETSVLYHIIPGESVIWRMDNGGGIDAVVVFHPPPAPFPSPTNDPHLSLLNQTMAYLESEMQKGAQH